MPFRLSSWRPGNDDVFDEDGDVFDGDEDKMMISPTPSSSWRRGRSLGEARGLKRSSKNSPKKIFKQ